jgi:hypothetical protein
MINGNRLIFVISPMASRRDWLLEYADVLFDVQDQNKIFFRFGSPAGLDSKKSPLPRMRLVIDEHLNEFKDTLLIYYGTDVVEMAETLYTEYPESEFLAMRMRKDMKPMLFERLERMTNGIISPDIINDTIERQFTIVDNFISEKETVPVNVDLTTVTPPLMKDGIAKRGPLGAFHIRKQD